jgi:HAD superfamily hydrolase (TIGR01490 family)
MAAAAFYDLDGTLVRTNLVHAFAFTARNQQGVLKSLVKTVTTLASVPMFLAADFYNRRLFNDLFFVRYKGESEDRLRAMSQELFDTVLRPSIFPGAYELIDKSRQLGLRQVIVTGALDITVAPLAKHLKIDDYVTNRLEFVDGYATGRLLPPIMAAATKASWMRIYAEKESLNLTDCYGYSDSMSDLPMLSVVGHPTAVNPDIRLRSTALQHDWPILDLR